MNQADVGQAPDEPYERALNHALGIWDALEAGKRRDKPHVVAVMTYAILEALKRESPRDGRPRSD